MSELRVSSVQSRKKSNPVKFPDGAVVTGVITSTNFSGNLNGNLVGNVTGNISGTTGSFTGNVSVGGTLTYDDVTNVDSIGIITGRKDLQINRNATILGITTIGSANDDLLTINSNTVLTDKLDVTKDTNLQADLTVAGHTTLNGNTVIGDNINVDEIKFCAPE